MHRPLHIFLSAFTLPACSDSSQDVNLQEKLKKDTTANSQQIIFAEPQTIDSSHIVIYPLILQKESYSSSYGSSSGGQRTSYWNLIFYNTETQNQNLLVTNRKMLIYSINFGASSSSSNSSDNVWTNGINVYKENVIYTAVAKDYNANKQLDENDPTYLFVSNKDGTNLRQISPDNYNINSWEVVKGTTKLIMQGQKDDNGDKVFNENDAFVPWIVDVNSQTRAVETFQQDFIDSLKQRLVIIWKR
jgi:hypothetical protein